MLMEKRKDETLSDVGFHGMLNFIPSHRRRAQLPGGPFTLDTDP